MRLRVVVAVIGFILSISFVLAQDSAAGQPYAVGDAYQVYNVLLPHEESVDFAKSTLVIRQETVAEPLPPDRCLTPEAASNFKDAIADYRQANSKQWILQRKFQSEKPYEIVSSETIETLFKRDGWDAFYKRYPGSGGYVIVSAVGFNRGKSQAIVYTGSVCGNLCGRWSFHLLEKVDGN
jgi:hypothetical protein